MIYCRNRCKDFIFIYINWMLKHLVFEINKTVSHFSPKVRLNAKKALIISNALESMLIIWYQFLCWWRSQWRSAISDRNIVHKFLKLKSYYCCEVKQSFKDKLIFIYNYSSQPLKTKWYLLNDFHIRELLLQLMVNKCFKIKFAINI